jgi:ERCC4-type nuclease
LAIVGRITRRLTILVDHGERASAVPAHLQHLGVAVDFRDLGVGDYIVGTVAVERKSFGDLHRSVASGRIWRQIGALRTTFCRRHLVLEGWDLYDGQIRDEGPRGALLTIADAGVCLLWSRNPRETAGWLCSITSRARGPAPRRRRAPTVGTPIAFLATIPGVSPHIGAELLRRFGSVTGVGEASENELRTVAGIGPSRAAAIKRVLG